MNKLIGKRIMATAKSMHAGQYGIVVADYGNYQLIKAEDEKYIHAHKHSFGEGKYFQVDSSRLKEVPNA